MALKVSPPNTFHLAEEQDNRFPTNSTTSPSTAQTSSWSNISCATSPSDCDTEASLLAGCDKMASMDIHGDHIKLSTITEIEELFSPAQTLVPNTSQDAVSPFSLSRQTSAEPFIDERRDSVFEMSLEPMTSPDSTVSIIIDMPIEQQEVKFTMHRDLLCYYSAYFRNKFPQKPVGTIIKKARIRSKMLRREWRWENAKDVSHMEGNGYGDAEGKIQIDVRVKLPDAPCEIRLDPDEVGLPGRQIFSAFVHWLYKGFAAFGLFAGSTEEKVDAATLIGLWVFAGKVGVPSLQNHCIEGIEFWRQTTGTIQTAALAWVYHNTQEFAPGTCAVKNLLIDHCAWKLDAYYVLSDHVKHEAALPRDALREIICRMRLFYSPTVEPPFATLQARQRNYWVPFENKRVVEVLGPRF